MKNFVTKGPKVSPIKSESFWRDTRPAANSHVHGTYHPVLDVRTPKTPEWCLPCNPVEPKKPRGTV